uniref:type II secretion system F family protein n=1 Tax=Pseudomonas viridiflava TaxID=33069 RepID=UPI00197D6D8E
RLVIGLSEVVQTWWLAIIGIFVGSFFIFKRSYKQSQKFRDSVDRFLLKIPLIGPLIFKSSVARYARTLATTFAAGVPLDEALDSVAGATGNVVFRNAVMKIKQDVSTGMQLNFSMRSTGVF